MCRFLFFLPFGCRLLRTRRENMLYKICKPGKLGQWIVAITACFCSMTSGQGFSWPSPALPMIISGTAGFNLTDVEQSWMVTITFIGNVVSPIPAGFVMDLIGRKNTLLVSLLSMIASWIIIYFSTTAVTLYIARFLAGLWAGVVYTVVPVFIGEVVDPDIRGAMGAMFGVNMYIGALYESLVGMGSYHTLAFLSGVPPTLLFVAFLFLPESPYYYLLKGKKEKARRSVIWLTGMCSDEKLDKMDAAVKEQLAKRGSFTDIFKTKASRRAFVIVEVLGVVQRGAGVTLLFAYVSITIPDSIVTATQSFIVLCVVWIVMSFSSSFIMDKFGRRIILLISCIGAGLAMLAVSIWFYLRDQAAYDVSNTNVLPLVFLIINGMFYSIGIVCIPQLVQGELFSVNIKAKASAIACITTSLASAITVKLYLPLTEYVGVYSNFLICFLSCLVGAIFSMTYMVETKGKTLEQIQDVLAESRKKKPRSDIPGIGNNV
ncbi:facilitated trehalose transporter Tret1-like [Cimex lectularius]|uniref:Major facilitator superfamily (MFS) profile domain-containing protein n=1 Tax=Cimex lectularius TaxID=79782 RepID=A0A8I6RAF1_CIMLE|nr:facilitated trehalose transporter Tret1-like [Cimex lectularius]